jgi:hypothetical protein
MWFEAFVFDDGLKFAGFGGVVAEEREPGL